MAEDKEESPGCITMYDLWWDEKVLDTPHYELMEGQD